MRGGAAKFNQPLHEIGEQGEPGPDEWRTIAQRVITMGMGATALVIKINTITAACDPSEPEPKPKPSNEDESETIPLSLGY